MTRSPSAASCSMARWKLDAEIRIIGLRSGEKISEELTAPDELAFSTSIEKICIVRTEVSEETLRSLEPFVATVKSGTDGLGAEGIREMLRELVGGDEAGYRLKDEDESNKPVPTAIPS